MRDDRSLLEVVLGFFHLLPAFVGFFLFLLAEALLWAAWLKSRDGVETQIRSRLAVDL